MNNFNTAYSPCLEITRKSMEWPRSDATNAQTFYCTHNKTMLHGNTGHFQDSGSSPSVTIRIKEMVTLSINKKWWDGRASEGDSTLYTYILWRAALNTRLLASPSFTPRIEEWFALKVEKRQWVGWGRLTRRPTQKDLAWTSLCTTFPLPHYADWTDSHFEVIIMKKKDVTAGQIPPSTSIEVKR